MVLPDTALVVFPDVEGVIITAGWGVGDKVAEKMMRNRQLRSLHIQYVFSRGNIIIIVYIVRNN